MHSHSDRKELRVSNFYEIWDKRENDLIETFHANICRQSRKFYYRGISDIEFTYAVNGRNTYFFFDELYKTMVTKLLLTEKS